MAWKCLNFTRESIRNKVNVETSEIIYTESMKRNSSSKVVSHSTFTRNKTLLPQLLNVLFKVVLDDFMHWSAYYLYSCFFQSLNSMIGEKSVSQKKMETSFLPLWHMWLPHTLRNVCCKYWIYSDTSGNYTVLSKERIADCPDNTLFYSVWASEDCDGIG